MFAKRVFLLPLVAVFSLLLLSPALAQTGSIAGTVTDAATGDPIWGVRVKADDGSAMGGGAQKF